ncbi:alpha/beta hydrolase [Parasedimentitalea maritima]|uniref:Alpha/beta fold hydrolase n=1 Tax=Parasedimentitalea maritima TaxID=2578117 RepID=A0A6A4RB26_9RHOB|nr:alpha/beta fold hydrolase [Zongyanglinia marina]KAE9627564.1 alpha/beta fold hydrolase [Zongyanglinia marina]
MRLFGKWLGRVLLALAVIGAALWAFGPYEEVDLKTSFEPRRFGEGVQVYFESIESQHKDVTPGVEKRVIWREGFKEQRTPVSVLYVHGFSATSEEIRPVPDQVAEALGANLVFTRLRGHGRSGEALADVTVNDWMMDMAEGLAAARQVGDRVVVIATSTGATLATAAAFDPEMSKSVAAMIFVSPNYGINKPLAPLLTLPAARYWVPLLAGRERTRPVQNADHKTYWTTTYPLVAVLPVAALVDTVAKMDVSQVDVPVLFWTSERDQVVRPDVTALVADRWGGPADLQLVVLDGKGDPRSHVIAGDIRSPDQTKAATEGFLKWLKMQGIE